MGFRGMIDAGSGGGGDSSDEEQKEEEDSSGGGMFGGVSDAFDTATDAANDAAADAAGWAEDVSGAEEFAESDQADEFREDMADAKEEGGIMGAAKQFDTAAKAGFDFLLDNPSASVQDTTREGIEAATGVESEDQGEAAADLAGDVSDGVQESIEGTALDNPVTDAAKGAMDVFVADPAKAALRGTTGISIDQGTTEGNVGALDAFDVGVTIGTAGVGKAGLAGLKGAAGAAKGADEAASLADEAGSFVASAFKSGDEAAAGADEAATAADDVAGASRWGGKTSGSGFISGLGGSGAGLADEATGLLDDVTTRFGRFTDDAAAGSDEAARGADEAAAGTDDAARATDDAATATDDAAAATDEAAQAGDESSGALRNLLGTKSGKVAAGTGGALAGGALLESLGAFDRLEVTDPTTGETYGLVREKQYQPTDQRDGGVLWEVKTGTSGNFTNSQGYTVMVGASGRNVYILDSQGNRTRAQVPVETFKKAVKRAKGNGGAA